ncbi:hypothetical protein ANANG_G00112990 [Anguilla anguilla]|uniref:Catenin delta 2 n=1 Tax=Anguilla anguilla TaxID=7936 RepID=A0A9D3MIP8_ANGAN|nr:hypothetical protein ANANG_G00112990 [Anguilla anguilla]
MTGAAAVCSVLAQEGEGALDGTWPKWLETGVEEPPWPRGRGAAWPLWTAPCARAPLRLAGDSRSYPRSSPCSTTARGTSRAMHPHLQHLTYKNDKVKSEVRRMKGIPSLVSLLDNPRKEVHHAACGALKNISYGRDHDNKIAIKNCDGVPALVRLLRKATDQDLTDTITGTLWNLSSHDSVKMEIVDHALNALSTEVMVLHSGLEQGGAEESCKPRHLEWEASLTNTTGCLRNVSSERSEARRKLRECTGLVDSVMYIVQSQIDRKEVDNKLTENSVCLLRNLSYQVHREIPGFERYQEAAPINQGPAPSSSQKTGCFSSRKGKDEWFSKGKREADDPTADMIDIPKRTTPAKGFELLFQPEVVRVYTSLLKESKNPVVLEAAAGAVQNLCAGRWTVSDCTLPPHHRTLPPHHTPPQP